MKASSLRPLSRFLGRFDAPVARRLQAVEVKTGPVTFVVGPERSGTTLVYSLLANHPDFYWLSRLDNVLPDVAVGTTLFRRLVDRWMSQEYMAIPGAVGRTRGLLPPSEGVEYWRGVIGWGDEGDYRRDDDRMTEAELDGIPAQQLRTDLFMRASLMGRPQVLVKQTGHALRTRLLWAVFENTAFVHVLRDPVTTWASLVSVKLRSRERYWGTKPPGWRTHLDSDPGLQAATQLEAVTAILDEDLAFLKGKGCPVLRIRFEDVLTDPSGVNRSFESFFGWPAGTLADRDAPSREGRTRPSPEDPKVRATLDRVCRRLGYQLLDT